MDELKAAIVELQAAVNREVGLRVQTCTTAIAEALTRHGCRLDVKVNEPGKEPIYEIQVVTK